MLRSPSTADENDEGSDNDSAAPRSMHPNQSQAPLQSLPWQQSPPPAAVRPVAMAPMHEQQQQQQQQQSIDYLLLDEALQGESAADDDDDPCDIADSTDSLLGRGSIELALSDDGVGSDTLLELVGGQRDLEQRMNIIEAQEGGSRDDEQLTIPSVIRIMYMGSCSEKDKRIVFRKLSRALSTLFHDCPSFFLRNPHMFKERKHHILLMSLIPGEDGEENAVETCEDNGLSIIEADFSWSTTTEQDKLRDMISHYLQIQCEQAMQQDPWPSSADDADAAAPLPPLSSSSAPLSSPLPRQNQAFDGFLYPEKTPNGIDLCIYFYDGAASNMLEDERVEDDLATLWQLKKLGIPIIPILSTALAGRRGSNSHQQQQQQPATRSVVDRRTRLAEMLARYKIRCIDIALSSLDVGQAPSFQRRNTMHAHANHAILERRLGREWAVSSITAPAPYNILTVDQFAALDRHAVFSILKQSRQKALWKEKVLQRINRAGDPASQHRPCSAEPPPRPSPSTLPALAMSDDGAASASGHVSHSSASARRRGLLWTMMVVPVVMALCWSHRSSSAEEVWTASVSVISNNASSFVLEIRGSSSTDERQLYEISVPVSSACFHASTPVPLASIQLMHPPRIDLVPQHSHCPPAPDDRPSPASRPSAPSLPHPDTASRWDQLYHTAGYLLGRPTKAVKMMFNRKQS